MTYECNHDWGQFDTVPVKCLLLNIYEGAGRSNKFYCCDISALPNRLKGHKGKELLPFVKIIDNFDARYEAVANDDTVFTFLTNKDAPRYKLVRVDLKEPSIWTEVLQEAEKDVLESAGAVNGNQIMVFVPSKDGTKIPVFMVAKKDILLDGSHPCLLFGYGGYGVNITSSFDVRRIVLVRHLGTVFCVANIRGGGEYGEEWHKAGSLAKKQNCFDDFISVPEYLVSAAYTKPSKLCIEGGSNGGILIGACINQRPDLFGCALAHVSVMDMLRYHKFTIGHAWVSEFGCSDNKEEFHWLIKYSPGHNVKRPWENFPVKACPYLPTMLLTADMFSEIKALHFIFFLLYLSLMC